LTTAFAALPEANTQTQADALLYRKISWHILPLLIAGYMVAYLDRVNIGYAQLQMKDALGFSTAAFGVGAGIMFLGYFLFEVPSNLLLERIGARKTFLRIMVLWGITASATMLVTTPAQFYAVRFLLGVFEAGYFPGVILYLTYWYPVDRRGRMVAIFSSASVLAGIAAGPLSGGTLKYLDHVCGLAGWQWLYLTQGVPAVVLGIAIYFFLKDRPALGGWLTAEDCARIQRDLGDKRVDHQLSSSSQLQMVLRMPTVWALILVEFLVLGAQYTMVFWIPSLIKGWGVSDPLDIGLYAAGPSVLGIVGMLLWGRSSDRFVERRWHFAACALITAAGLSAIVLLDGRLVPSMVALCVAAFGMAPLNPLLTTALTDFLPRQIAAPGIALITSCGILGAAASPIVTGVLNAETGTTIYSMYLVIGLFIFSAIVLLAALPHKASTLQLEKR
jgi:sugar phosphate permease